MNVTPLQVFQDIAVELVAAPPEGLSPQDVALRLALLRPQALEAIRHRMDTQTVPTPGGGLRGTLALHPHEIVIDQTRVVDPQGRHGVVSKLELTRSRFEKGSYYATLTLDLRRSKRDTALTLYPELRPAVPDTTGDNLTPERLWQRAVSDFDAALDAQAAYRRARADRSKREHAERGLWSAREAIRRFNEMAHWLRLGLPPSLAYSAAGVADTVARATTLFEFFKEAEQHLGLI